MSRAGAGPRLWKRPGNKQRNPVWVIKDGNQRISTGIVASPLAVKPPAEAEQALTTYLLGKHTPDRKLRPVEDIFMEDVLTVYHDDKVGDFETEARRREFIRRIGRLNDFFGEMKLTEINKTSCETFVRDRKVIQGARRDLEDLRAAINHHAALKLHHAVITVTLPEKSPPRERWLDRSEAARLLWAAWRYKEVQTIHSGDQKGEPVETTKFPLRHVARFILIGLYTGTRAGAIATASPFNGIGLSYVDLDRGIYNRLAKGKRKTKKRQPPVRLPPRLTAHMRRWFERGHIAKHFIEFNGKPVKSVKKGFAHAVSLAKLSNDAGKVTPHTLRHTAATWLMQRGADPWEAAGYLGMSLQTLLNSYGHHHPDFMSGAIEAITRKERNLNSSKRAGAGDFKRPLQQGLSI
jgi:integrase